MKRRFLLGAVVAIIPTTVAVYADSTGAGSGQPGAWSSGSAGVSAQMRPPIKSTKINVNHTNVTTSNATTSASTSSSTAPDQAIQVKVKANGKVERKLK